MEDRKRRRLRDRKAQHADRDDGCEFSRAPSGDHRPPLRFGGRVLPDAWRHLREATGHFRSFPSTASVSSLGKHTSNSVLPFQLDLFLPWRSDCRLRWVPRGGSAAVSTAASVNTPAVSTWAALLSLPQCGGGRPGGKSRGLAPSLRCL